METADPQAAVRAACERQGVGPRAIWPNALGYDWRGWSYMRRDDGTWRAIRRTRRGTLEGGGDTPEAARQSAREVL